jgi:hypothetical protein
MKIRKFLETVSTPNAFVGTEGEHLPMCNSETANRKPEANFLICTHTPPLPHKEPSVLAGAGSPKSVWEGQFYKN